MLANPEIQKIFAQSNVNKQSLKKLKAKQIFFTRNRVIILLVFVATLAVIVKLLYMNTLGNSFLAKQMSSRIERTIKITAMRGSITDRNGKALAVSTPVASIWLDPTELDELTNEQIKQLASILKMSVAEINSKMNEKNKTFVYLKRAVTPEQAEKVKALGIAGIYNIQEYKRFYPSAEVAAHIVGFNNIDDIGVAGIEYAQNKNLIGSDGEHKILRDRNGHVIEDLGVIKEAHDGKTIALAMDNRIQFIAYQALKEQVEKMKADSGSAVVLDAKTGEVLAMVNMPSFNPNIRTEITSDKTKNSAIVSVYDPGSIMKPIVIAKALDDKIVTPKTIFDTHEYYVGPKLIKDDHPMPSMDVEGILIHSSDIGTSKIALKYKPTVLYDYYHKVGFGEKLNTGFPGETRGLILDPKKLYPLDQALNSFGYGISVSLLQMAHAYTLFTNDGCILPVSFYKITQGQKVECDQIINPKTAYMIRDILAKNNEVGTGKNAQVADYTTAGKTGTAQKLINGRYSNHNHIASFVGFAPVKDPKLVIAVSIDNPSGTYYGSTVAAPVFSKIAAQALPALGVKPDKK